MLAELAAAASSVAGEDIQSWLQSLGPFSAAAFIGYQAWKREAARADAERDRANALMDRVVDDVIPAIERSTARLGEFVDAAKELRWEAQHGRRDSTARSGPDHAGSGH